MMATATAKNGITAAATSAVLDQLKPPDGIIIPPPGEIREAIEKTAGYVLRGGVGLEQRIRENHGTNPKFSFLVSKDDAYNLYYEWRKAEIKAGRGTFVSAGRDPGATSVETRKPKGPPKPAELLFSARMPRMSQKDLEIVRLTALFVAKNGRQFMTQLAQREAGNPQFQFLVPNHTFHNFFQHMVDQYSIILSEAGTGENGAKTKQRILARLREHMKDKYAVLERAKNRSEYATWQESEREKQDQEWSQKMIDFMRIDWNDFIVVETITFTESDDAVNLPPPTTLNDIQYASLEERNKLSVNASLRIEEAFPFEDTHYNVSPMAPQPVYQPQAQPLPTSAAATTPAKAKSRQEEDEEEEGEEEDAVNRKMRDEEEARARLALAQAGTKAAPVKIKDNYVPRAATKAANQWRQQKALCPNCKQEVPLDELEAHMRIELLDPSWKEQQAKEAERHATTNIWTADVAGNAKRLASQRTDLFDGVTGEALTEEEKARRKRAALNSYDGIPILDGRGSGAQMLDMAHPRVNVEEQIRAIHEKFSQPK